MSIHVLDPTVAAKIAAGEVVERPASVVKELVENSLDAGAAHITVEIRRGGMELIRVTDDGEGIPVLDLELALERHATSKVSSIDGLSAIATMGFRGEALPSIAAVSRLTLTSRARGSEQGAYVRARDGVVERKGAAGCPEGTSVSVQGIFAGVPARRKFLRSDASESGRTHRVVEQLALAHPRVRFRLASNGRETFASPGTGGLRDTLAVVYDQPTAESLLELSGSDPDGRSLQGFASPAGVTRSNRGGINFYVNSRWVLSRILLQAVEEAYRGLLMEGRHPVVALHLSLPPHEVDVNVHPAKHEVRFHREGAVFSLVQRSVREALVAHSPVPVVGSRHYAADFRPDAGPITAAQSRMALDMVPRRDPQAAPQQVQDEEPGGTTPSVLPALRVLGQASNTYIIAEGPEGVYLIDQHAAHERVRYEELLQQAGESRADVQGLLEPYTVELLPSQVQLLEEWGPTLEAHGFQGEPFGDRTYLLRGVPGGLREDHLEEMLSETLEVLSRASETGEAQESLAASVACHSAIRAGDQLSPEEMISLVRQLEATRSPHTCPHGRPTMLHLSTGSLDREFRRR